MNASRLIEANIRAHTVDGYTAHHMVADAHERTIRALAAELAVLRGEGQTACCCRGPRGHPEGHRGPVVTAATLTRWTSPGYVLRRLWRALRIALLTYQIHETEAYLRACARDGLVNSLSLQQFRWDLASMRCRLALLKEF